MVNCRPAAIASAVTPQPAGIARTAMDDNHNGVMVLPACGVPIVEHELYSLHLANGDAWRFSCSEDAAPLLEQFAFAVGLRKTSEFRCPTLFFTRTEPSRERLSRGRWRRRELRFCILYQDQDYRNAICQVKCHDGKDAAYVRDAELVTMWHSLSLIYDRGLEGGGLPLHAALVERDGTCVAIAARGNVGKSTCCERIPPPWHALCDDEVLALRCGSGYVAHPLPTWSDLLNRGILRSSNTQEIRKPLKAILFLEQADGDSLERLECGSAAIRIVNSSGQVLSRGSGDQTAEQLRATRCRTFENACEMAKVIPCYRLRASLTGAFWEEMKGLY